MGRWLRQDPPTLKLVLANRNGVLGHGSAPDQLDRLPRKDEDDEQSFAEEDSYFSGEQYLHTKSVEQVAALEDPMAYVTSDIYGRTAENDLIAQYDGQLMDVEELNLMRAEPVWQGFVTQSDELIMLENGKVLNEYEQPKPNDLYIDDDQLGSVRSIGVGINSDAADIGSEVRESLVGGSSEGDIEYFHDHDVGMGGIRQSQPGTDKSYLFQKKMDKTKKTKQQSDKYIMALEKGFCPMGMNCRDGRFSFRPPSGTGDMLCPDSANTLWSSKGNAVDADNDEPAIGTSTDDMLATWRQKSSDSSPTKGSRNEKIADAIRSRNSILSSALSYANAEREDGKKGHYEKAIDAIEEEPETGTTLEDEEAAAVQEQLFSQTGFEEDKSFHVVLNSVIAGRYHVTEYLGSAAFSKAIQAHDLHTGMDVCVKIIKNNKDFFDQSLDEIKLLKFVNKNDPADKYHILRLYDYFYYREHLLIVCELLKANLYEFHKFNREAGGEVYFTMPRLQSITIQCLEALQFLHGLGLIHCDLKPENILIKSYSRCEVKVIDLGLPYDEKIDIWSLGCILAELCTGIVLFTNDSPATLLARVIGIIGSIDQVMLAKGRDTYKYFTKNYMLYERNQETNRLEYLFPKRTSLRHRLPMGDQGFIDFVAHLLEINPEKRPTASEALKHPWLSYPYEPISS
ncbi:putative Serine/threonine-protein kinase AFC2 [Cocos nucifera]|uniref:Putative Serine/threonine-protein kinase AFC2 n=1 Tax=Cocos nucifera TaxID=13894 RepID=A0A8K0IHS4_COCNU|nr:putative Serine/threonine-protein kinase AFC2 [Cocos nucifera]